MPLSFFFFSFSILPIFLSVKIISPPLPFFFPSTVRVDFFLSQWGRGESGKAKNNYEILGVCVSFKSYNVFFLPERGQNLKFKKINLILAAMFFPSLLNGFQQFGKIYFLIFSLPSPPFSSITSRQYILTFFFFPFSPLPQPIQQNIKC